MKTKTFHNTNYCSLKGLDKQMESTQLIYDMAEVFKALNDPTRLKIINLLIISEL